MSIHRSLKVSGSLLRERNVWTRIERLEALQKKGEWSEGESIYGLRKVRTSFGVKKAKKGKDSADEKAAE
ncbi:MAG: hypothetical protein DHS20C15_23060 [Planctomycetota bacterium]|nr:MAG: hypothetical protein DHS20C15_23060 [Planctomycetota bacterium]